MALREDCPVLLIAHRRPSTTREVLNAIRIARPSRLYVACDGPNLLRPQDSSKVRETRQVIEEAIDWPCQVSKLYSEENLGCRLGVSQALSWFFKENAAGIILEDDCVPHIDFFMLCSELLQRYQDDTRVWSVCGSNFQDGRKRGGAAYYFSQFSPVWGWATWRRCWQSYDANLINWPHLKSSGLIESIFNNEAERCYFASLWDELFVEDRFDTWDFQWEFTCLINGGLAAIPNVNLVRNIGFGSDSTHTHTEFVDTTVSQGLGELSHPSLFLKDSAADRYYFDHRLHGKDYRRKLTAIGSLERFLKVLKKRILEKLPFKNKSSEL